MGSLCSTRNLAGFNRLVIEDVGQGGVYAFAFERADSAFPEWDYLLRDLDEAKAFCLETWGSPLDSWSATAEAPSMNDASRKGRA
jgi:hypothetical protein